MIRFVKRRNPSARPVLKPDGIIIFQGSTRNWRERVKALKAAQAASHADRDASAPAKAEQS